MSIFSKPVYRYADMHSHILPGLDDGARDISESVKMLDIAYKNGIRDIIVTPHYKLGRNNASYEQILAGIDLLAAEASGRGININMYPGNEIFYFEEIVEYLDNNKVLTLNGTDRVLVEFSPSCSYRDMRNAFDKLLLGEYVPILAHAERYACMLENPSYVDEVKSMGVEIQINAGSYAGVMGHRTKKFINGLMKKQLIDYVGTDAHDPHHRKPDMSEQISSMYRHFEKEYVNQITFYNTYDIIRASR